MSTAPQRPSKADPLEPHDQLNTPEPEDTATAAADSGTAFAELQELFPGRILEIIKDQAVVEQPTFEEEDQSADLDDDEGYDDPNQSRLSFGSEN